MQIQPRSFFNPYNWSLWALQWGGDFVPLTKHCQLSHTHSELHTMNKPTMTDLNTEKNKTFLQQSSLNWPSTQRELMNEQSWHAIAVLTVFRCKPSPTQCYVLVYTKPTRIACEGFKGLSLLHAVPTCHAQSQVHLVLLWFCFTKYMYKNMKQTAGHRAVRETRLDEEMNTHSDCKKLQV